MLFFWFLLHALLTVGLGYVVWLVPNANPDQNVSDDQMLAGWVVVWLAAVYMLVSTIDDAAAIVTVLRAAGSAP